jgi:TM2 domain-containing membrane protein YozV
MKKYLISLSVLLLPAIASAQNGVGYNLNNTATGLESLVKTLTNIANAMIPFLLAVAVVVFIYGVIRFILANGAEDKALARNYIIYGIIGIAVIVSLFGLITLLQGAVGINGTETVKYPQF